VKSVGNTSTNVSKEPAAYPEKEGSTGAYRASYPRGQEFLYLQNFLLKSLQGAFF